MKAIINKLSTSFKEIFRKITINDLYTAFILISLFLYSLNAFMITGQIFLVLLIIVVSIKMLVCGEFRINSSLIAVSIFAMFFIVFHTLNYGFNFKDVIRLLVCPIGFYIVGSNLIKTYKNKQKLILNVLFAVAAGFAVQSTLNMIARGFGFGFFSTTRIAINFWTGRIQTPTGVSMVLSFITAFIFPIILIKSKEKKWYHVVIAILGFIIAIIASFQLSNRSPIFIVAAVIFVAALSSIVFDKKLRKKILIILATGVTLLVILVIAYKLKIFGIDQLLLKIPYFKRILTTDTSAFVDVPRLDIYANFFRNWHYFPFGGAKIPLGPDIYCHNVWFDIYFETGIFPAVCFIIVTVMFLKRLIQIAILEKDVFLKVFMICSTVSLFLIFAVEPVYQGNIYFFMVFFLLFGLVDGLARELDRDFIHKLRRPLPGTGVKVVFISNYLSLHQIAFCREMTIKYGERFNFISMDDAYDQHIKSEFYSDSILKRVASMSKDSKYCQKILDEADVLIFGSAPDKLMLPQLKKGKLVFKYSERLYKSGKGYEYFLPRSLISQYLHYKRFQKYHMYHLCASAYLPLDLSKLEISPKRCFKWGYFALENKYENFDELFANKNKTEVTEILFVNRLIKWKHPEKCVVVAKYLQEKKIPFIMKLIGTGDEKTTKLLEKIIAEANLEDKVILLGTIKNEQVRTMMEHANIILANSDYGEGWGVCINEALESGCAIVASHSQGSVPYLLENHINGLIYEFGDDDGMCHRVEQLCLDRDLQESLGRNGFSTIKLKWNAKNAVINFAATVDKMLSNEELPDIDQSGPMGRVEIIDHDWLEKQKKANVALKNKENTVKGKVKEKGGQIRTAAVIAYLAVALNIIAGLLYTPWMVNTLNSVSEKSYSIYTLAMSITGLLTIDFGLGEAVSKYLAKYRAENDSDKANKFMGLIYKLFLIIDAGIFVVLAVMFIFIKQIYGNSYTAPQLDQLRIVFVMVGLYSLISFGARPMNGVYIAHEKFAVFKTIDFIHKLITIVLVVAALLMGYDLYAVVLANCFAGLLSLLLKYIYMKKNIDIKPDFKYKNRALTKGIFKFSVWTMVITICQKFILSITPSVLSIFNGDAHQIAVWGIAIVIEGYSYTLSSTFNDLFLPRVSKMDTANASPKEMTRLMIKLGRIQLLTSGMILIGFIALGQGFIRTWMGNNDYSDVYFVALFLLLPCFISYTQRVGITVLIVKDKIKYYAYSGIVTAVVSLILSILLSMKFGAIGSAFGIFIGETVGYITVLNYFFVKEGKLNVKDFFKNVHLKFILQIIVCLVFGLALEYFLPTTGWLMFIAKGGIFVLFYLIVMWFTAINREEKNILFNIAKSIINSLLNLYASVIRLFKKVNN